MALLKVYYYVVNSFKFLEQYYKVNYIGDLMGDPNYVELKIQNVN